MTDKGSAPTISIYDKKKRPSDLILLVIIYACAFLAVLLLVGIIGYVLYRGLPVIDWQFLSTAQSALNGTFGILPNIINTLYIIVITLVIATPIGIGAAIYLNEYSKGGKLVRLIEFTTETLSGIPSIIFGLFGMVFFGGVLKLGFSILCGSLTLTIMILPIITRTTQEALKTVPESYRTGALGIGATKWYMIRTIILPSAIPGIITGVILSIGRIVGESAALLFTAGSGYLMVSNWLTHPLSPGGTLTIQMYLSMTKAKYDDAFGIALVLVVIVLAINFLTKVLSRKLDVNKRG
ncbi:MAG: phosphate ABC transporter permease PstA [Massiliimalia sp.]|jgi:phosphate transport system permease protein